MFFSIRVKKIAKISQNNCTNKYLLIYLHHVYNRLHMGNDHFLLLELSHFDK